MSLPNPLQDSRLKPFLQLFSWSNQTIRSVWIVLSEMFIKMSHGFNFSRVRTGKYRTISTAAIVIGAGNVSGRIPLGHQISYEWSKIEIRAATKRAVQTTTLSLTLICLWNAFEKLSRWRWFVCGTRLNNSLVDVNSFVERVWKTLSLTLICLWNAFEQLSRWR